MMGLLVVFLLSFFLFFVNNSFTEEFPLFVAQQVTNPTSTHQDADSVPSLVQWVKDLLLPCTAV